MTSLIYRFPFLADLLRSRPTRPAPHTQHAPAAPAADARSGYPELEDARGEAMRRMFPKLYSWCASQREWSMATDAYRYLSDATSVADLEQRIRALEKSRSFGPN